MSRLVNGSVWALMCSCLVHMYMYINYTLNCNLLYPVIRFILLDKIFMREMQSIVKQQIQVKLDFSE